MKDANATVTAISDDRLEISVRFDDGRTTTMTLDRPGHEGIVGERFHTVLLEVITDDGRRVRPRARRSGGR